MLTQAEIFCLYLSLFFSCLWTWFGGLFVCATRLCHFFDYIFEIQRRGVRSEGLDLNLISDGESVRKRRDRDVRYFEKSTSSFFSLSVTAMLSKCTPGRRTKKHRGSQQSAGRSLYHSLASMPGYMLHTTFLSSMLSLSDHPNSRNPIRVEESIIFAIHHE